jgi:hypothetical protein
MSLGTTIQLTEEQLLEILETLPANAALSLCDSNSDLQRLCDDPTSAVGQLILDKISQELEMVDTASIDSTSQFPFKTSRSAQRDIVPGPSRANPKRSRLRRFPTTVSPTTRKEISTVRGDTSMGQKDILTTQKEISPVQVDTSMTRKDISPVQVDTSTTSEGIAGKSRTAIPKSIKIDPKIQRTWKLVGQALKERSLELEVYRGRTVIIVDFLNATFHNYLEKFEGRIGVNVERASEYIVAPVSGKINESPYVGGICQRVERLNPCRSRVGIQRLRLGDPLTYEMQETDLLNDRERLYLLAAQAPDVEFIIVERRPLKRGTPLDFKKNNKTPPNVLRVLTNSNLNKEIDDLTVVSLYIRLRALGADAYINTCDKYRWMNKILQPNVIASVKRDQVSGYFLSPDFFIGPPALILMGYECAYDCSKDQGSPFASEIDLSNLPSGGVRCSRSGHCHCQLKDVREKLQQPKYL